MSTFIFSGVRLDIDHRWVKSIFSTATLKMQPVDKDKHRQNRARVFPEDF